MRDPDDCVDYYDSEEWDETRNEILYERGSICERCGATTDSPHVHHVNGRGSGLFEVLCPECHAEHHDNPEILIYQADTPKCKFCGKEIRWLKIDGRWVPHEPKHRNDFCDHRHHCEKRGSSK